MAWTTPRTWVTGETVTVALMNTHVRDNMNTTAAATLTTTGDIVYASGANTPARLAAGTTGQFLRGGTTPSWSNNILGGMTIGGTGATGGGSLNIHATGGHLDLFESDAADPDDFYRIENSSETFVIAHYDDSTTTWTSGLKVRNSGQVAIVQSGSLSVPSLSWDANTDVGFVYGTSPVNQIAIIVDGESGCYFFQGGVAFTGVGLRVGDGADNAPSLSFSTDADLGFYKSAGDEVSVSAFSTQVMYWNSTRAATSDNVSFFKLPVKSTTGDPSSPANGDCYVNTFDNKVRVYADAAWRDLVTW